MDSNMASCVKNQDRFVKGATCPSLAASCREGWGGRSSGPTQSRAGRHEWLVVFEDLSFVELAFHLRLPRSGPRHARLQPAPAQRMRHHLSSPSPRLCLWMNVMCSSSIFCARAAAALSRRRALDRLSGLHQRRCQPDKVRHADGKREVSVSGRRRQRRRRRRLRGAERWHRGPRHQPRRAQHSLPCVPNTRS